MGGPLPSSVTAGPETRAAVRGAASRLELAARTALPFPDLPAPVPATEATPTPGVMAPRKLQVAVRPQVRQAPA